MRVLIIALTLISQFAWSQTKFCDSPSIKNVPRMDAEIYFQNSDHSFISFTNPESNEYKNFVSKSPKMEKVGLNFFKKVDCARASSQSRAYLENFKRLGKHKNLKVGLFIKKLPNGKLSYELSFGMNRELVNSKFIVEGNIEHADIAYLLNRPLEKVLEEARREKVKNELIQKFESLSEEALKYNINLAKIIDDQRSTREKQERILTEDDEGFIGPKRQVRQE